jgi:hypothetical protein
LSEFDVAAADAVEPFACETEPLAPASPTRADTFVFDAPSWLELALASAADEFV